MPEVHGIYWLRRNAGTDRLLRFFNWVSYLVPVLLIAAMVYGYYAFQLDKLDELDPTKKEKLAGTIAELKKATAVLIVIVSGIPFLLVPAIGNLRRRLGTDGHRIYVRMTDGTQISFTPEQAVYGTRQICFKDLVVGIQTGNRLPLYEKGEVETYIAPLLARTRKVSPLGLVRHSFAHPDRVTLIMVIYVGLVVGLVIATGLWERMFLSRF